MKVAVVCRSQQDAVELIARLGMVGKALPLCAESSALLGHHFTAVVVRSTPKTGVKDPDWWEQLFSRNTGPVYVLSEMAMSQDAIP